MDIWNGRPTRHLVLAPKGVRERFAAWLGRSLLTRWEHELRAETMRADAMTESYVEAKRG